MDPTTPTPSAAAASPNESGKAAPSAAKSVDEWHLPLRSDEELKQLARDLVAGKVTTDAMVGLAQFRLTFACISVMTPAQVDVLKAECGLVYEYNAQASPMSCNGYPLFMSAKFLHRDQAEQLLGYVVKIQTALADL